MTLLLKLFWEFFKIGIFAIGGGMATIPFLQELGQRSGWFGQRFITDMVAISESTPGPIGINMATYVGFSRAGMAGGIIATLGIVVPAIVIVTAVSKSLEKFCGNKYVEYMFYGLRPAVTGLIAAAGFNVFRIAVIRIGGASMFSSFPWGRMAYFALILFLIRKYKKHPIVYIACSAAVGIIAAPAFM